MKKLQYLSKHKLIKPMNLYLKRDTEEELEKFENLHRDFKH